MNTSILKIKKQLNHPKKCTWEGVEIVDMLAKQFHIPAKGAYGYTHWLRLVKDSNINLYQAEKVISIMERREKWLYSNYQKHLQRDKWWFNRLNRDFKKKSIDHWIAKND